jgi:hypothetical protein
MASLTDVYSAKCAWFLVKIGRYLFLIGLRYVAILFGGL